MSRPIAEPERPDEDEEDEETEETEEPEEEEVQDKYEDRFFMDNDEPYEHYRPRKSLDEAKEILDEWLATQSNEDEERIRAANYAWMYPDLWTARKMNLVFVQALIYKFGHKGWPRVEGNLTEKRRTKTELKNRYALTACMTAIRTLEGLPEDERQQATTTPRKGGRTSTLGQYALQRYIAQHMPASSDIKANRVKNSLEFIKKEYSAKSLMLRRLLKEFGDLNNTWSPGFSVKNLRALEYRIVYYKIELLRMHEEKIEQRKLDDFLYKIAMQQTGEILDIYYGEEKFSLYN